MGFQLKIIIVIVFFLLGSNITFAQENSNNSELSTDLVLFHYLQGNQYIEVENYSLALLEYEKGWEISKKNNDIDGIVYNSIMTGFSAHMMHDNYADAQKILFDSIPYSINHKEEALFSKTYGIILLEGGTNEEIFNEGRKFLIKALNLYKKKNDSEGIFTTLDRLRFWYLYNGNFKEAESFFKDYQKFFQDTGEVDYSEEIELIIEEFKTFQIANIKINESWTVDKKNNDLYHITINLSVLSNFDWPTDYEPIQPAFLWALEPSNNIINLTVNRIPSIKGQYYPNFSNFSVGRFYDSLLSESAIPLLVYYFPEIMFNRAPEEVRREILKNVTEINESFSTGEMINLFMEFDTPRKSFSVWKSGIESYYDSIDIEYEKEISIKVNDYFVGYPYNSPQIENDGYKISWNRNLNGNINGIPNKVMIKDSSLRGIRSHTFTVGENKSISDEKDTFLNYFYLAKPLTQTSGSYEKIEIYGNNKPEKIFFERTENREIIVPDNDILVKTYIYYDGDFSDIKLKLIKPYDIEFNVPKDLDEFIRNEEILENKDFSQGYLYIGKNDPYINEDNKYLLVFRLANVSDKNIEFKISYPLSTEIIKQLNYNEYELTYNTLYQPGRYPTFIEVNEFILSENFTILNTSEGINPIINQNIAKFETKNEPFQPAKTIKPKFDTLLR